MGAEIRIESLYDQAWASHGDDYRQAVADRDHFRAETQDRLGPEVAAEIQSHVDAALGRLLADDLPDLDPTAKRRFHEFLALERAVIEIGTRIETGNMFFDPYINGLFPMSWWELVLPLLPENPGFLPVEGVSEFLAMVVAADQRLPSGGETGETAGQFWRRRRELVKFLERAIRLKESIWCDL